MTNRRFVPSVAGLEGRQLLNGDPLVEYTPPYGGAVVGGSAVVVDGAISGVLSVGSLYPIEMLRPPDLSAPYPKP